jgi:hypothetical protein
MVHAAKPSKGVTLMGILLAFGAAMGALAGALLIWPGSFLDRLWALNPVARVQLVPLGAWIGIPFLLLGATLALTCVLWFQRRLWGWRLAVGIIAAQVLGGLVHVLYGEVLQGLTGLAVSSALLFYLFRPHVKSLFAQPLPPR